MKREALKMTNSYFNALNYTLANEDTELEWAILPNASKHIMAVAGSGSRVVPLLAKFPQRLTCIDVSPAQLAVTQLRLELVRLCSVDEYSCFLGYDQSKMTSQTRRQIFDSLKLNEDARGYLSAYLSSIDWGPIIYKGRWEKHFISLARIVKTVLGQGALGIFECQNLEEQKKYFSQKFPSRAWEFLVFIMSQSVVFNALLYGGHFPKINLNQSAHKFYREVFHRIFSNFLARQNFFIQLLLLGEVRFPEARPIECREAIFIQAKEAVKNCEIIYRCDNVIDGCQKSEVKVDFLSLSDVPSYFHPPLEQDFLQRLASMMNPGSLIVSRSYLRVPWRVDTSGYTSKNGPYKPLFAQEKVQMYLIDVYERGMPSGGVAP